MPIPPFNSEGLLPGGIHQASLEEIIQRFGGPSAVRHAIAESLKWAFEAAIKAGISRFIVDGSFVDRKADPNDVDCILLSHADYPRDSQAARELEEGIPYVQILVFEDSQDFEDFLRLQFMVDRRGRSRGVVEIRLS